MSSRQLSDFLNAKPLYYKEIDYERIYVAYDVLKTEICHPQTIHVVGTNGKGSTGRMIAFLASRGGLSVGHYSSPHILKFNERIWLNGTDVSDAVLEKAHQKLFSILGEVLSESLSYFEYMTLLAFVVFENCDLMVLEAGLGGEFDATNVCAKALLVITPIGIDHQAFLGDSIEAIAGTKMRAMQQVALLAPQPYAKVVEIAQNIARQKGATLFFIEKAVKRSKKLQDIAKEKAWGDYLVDNAMVALRALDILHINYEIDTLKDLVLFGRFYAFKDNIRIDVGHNPLAARAIEKALKQKVVLIYNSLDDKEYEEVLRILKPKIKRVEIIEIQSQRATVVEEIEKALQKVGLDYSVYNNTINEDENYLVFGSFYVVEAFLKQQKYIGS